MKCPVDRHELVVRPRDGHIGHACAACGGAWLPGVFLESVALERHSWLTTFYAELASRAMPSRTLPCPTGCGTLACASVHDVEIDWCVECRGAWFDPGELGRVLQHHPVRDRAVSGNASGVAGHVAADVGMNALWLLFVAWLG